MLEVWLGRHALECVRLAQTSATPQSREHFAQLARTWITLAEEIEQNEALVARLDEDFPANEQPA